MKTLQYLTIIIILFFNACIKHKKTSERSNYSSTNDVTSENPSTPEIHTSAQNIKIEEILSIIDFKLGDKIALDSPKRFIQISIMFTLEQHSNYYQVHQIEKQSDVEINEYMTAKRNEFYNKLGILEDEYIKYSINNAEQIQEFLINNPKFEHAYETVLDQVTD